MPRRETLLLVLGAPVTLICLTHGHNGFLTALLLGGGLMLLDRKPFVAGLLIGCLIYKPQFALIIPVLLLAGRNWRAIAGACVSGRATHCRDLAHLGLSGVAGLHRQSPANTHGRDRAGRDRLAQDHESAFGAMRMWGAGLPASYAVQLCATLMAMWAVALLTWRRADAELRNALVCATTLLSTPYVLDYDAVVLLPALAWLWLHGQANGFLTWEKSLLLIAWFTPLMARHVAEWSLIPLGLAPALTVAAIAFRRAVVLRHHHSAVDVQRLPGDVAGLAAR